MFFLYKLVKHKTSLLTYEKCAKLVIIIYSCLYNLIFEVSKQSHKSTHDDVGTSLDNELVRAPTNETKERLQSKLARAREKYATLTPEQKQAKVDQRRTQRQSLTKEQRLELNARRRVARQSMPDVEIHDMNACRRSRRQNVTPGERSAHLARRNALYAARRDKPCAESIALECPEGSIPLLLNPTPCLETTGDVPSTSSLQTEHAVDHQARSCTFNDDDMDSFMDDDSDDEYYMFAGLGDDEDDEMVQSDDDDTQSPTSSVPDPFDYMYSNIPQSTNVLKPEPDCKHCGAKRFQYEPPSFCCRGGKIKLVQNETPPELMRLWTSSDPDAKHFRDNNRYFNGHFSFTTLGVSLDKAFANMSSGVYTFRAHGQIYHNIHSFSPRDSGPEHLELYFYDDDPTLSHRFQRSPSLDQDVIRTVADVLRNNPYSETFRSLGQAEDLANYRVTLNLDHRLHQRRYNVPVTTEVAAIWVEGNERRKFEPSVTIYRNNRTRKSIQPFYECYDPLSYPLFFPRGENGWHQSLPKDKITMEDANARNGDDPDCNSRIRVSVRDYYCYKFQMRRGIFNPILHGGLLFQQFAVDMYIKVESSRLDYVRNNQKEIRADLYQGLMDSIQAGESRASAVGKRTVLPALFVCGGRNMKRRYMDAMALV
ncbi:hypothetical protein OsI_03059 [Oryza sativa Indica Group]|uniref:Helitron helicase-like domain-containing protein n=1 Tax=Oryza sativa subsp. indica TaxID=39946 RepID=B8A6W1_ORYSI|nr:hypothetical protein OsI_03059 [Oryza sativa Indica Group]